MRTRRSQPCPTRRVIGRSKIAPCDDAWTEISRPVWRGTRWKESGRPPESDRGVGRQTTTPPARARSMVSPPRSLPLTRSSSPPSDAPCTGCRGAATGASTTPSAGLGRTLQERLRRLATGSRQNTGSSAQSLPGPRRRRRQVGERPSRVFVLRHRRHGRRRAMTRGRAVRAVASSVRLRFTCRHREPRHDRTAASSPDKEIVRHSSRGRDHRVSVLTFGGAHRCRSPSGRWPSRRSAGGEFAEGDAVRGRRRRGTTARVAQAHGSARAPPDATLVEEPRRHVEIGGTRGDK